MIIKTAENDKYNAKKENIYHAYLDGEICGSVYIYPYEGSPNIEFPRNINIDIYNEGKTVAESVKDALLEKAIERAKEIKEEIWTETTKIFACFLANDHEGIEYFKSKGFVHDSGMYVMRKNLTKDMPSSVSLEDLQLRAWQMESQEEESRFIEVHKKHFRERSHYSHEKLENIRQLPLWMNFTVFSEECIVGNIMLCCEESEDKTGFSGWIEDLFVENEWRRRGVAKALLVQSMHYFNEHGLDQVALEVWRENQSGLALYESLGFEAVEETQVALGIYI